MEKQEQETTFFDDDATTTWSKYKEQKKDSYMQMQIQEEKLMPLPSLDPYKKNMLVF